MQVTVTSINCAFDQCRSCGSQIIINNNNYSPKRDGINVAVYNPKQSEVVISASFQNPSSILFEKFINSIKDGHVIIVTSQLICSNNEVTNLRIQKNVINAFRKLGVSSTLLPIEFRSGVMIYCKNKCLPEFSINIKLPFTKMKSTNEDPALVSFYIEANDGTFHYS